MGLALRFGDIGGNLVEPGERLANQVRDLTV